VSYTTETLWVYGIYTEDPDLIELSTCYDSDPKTVPDTPLIRAIAAIAPAFGEAVPGDWHFRLHTEGDFAAPEFCGAVLGLRLDPDWLDDPQRLRALQAQARQQLDALRAYAPRALSGAIRTHQIQQAG